MSTAGRSPRARIAVAVRRAATTPASHGLSASVCCGTRARVRAPNACPRFPTIRIPGRKPRVPAAFVDACVLRNRRRRSTRPRSRPTPKRQRAFPPTPGAHSRRRRVAPGAHASPRAALDRPRVAPCRPSDVRRARAHRRRCPSARDDARFARTSRLGLLRHAGSRALPAPYRRAAPVPRQRLRSPIRVPAASVDARPTSPPTPKRQRAFPPTSGRAGNAREPACRTRPTSASRVSKRGPQRRFGDAVARCRRRRFTLTARARCAWFLRLGLLRHARTRAFPAPHRRAAAFQPKTCGARPAVRPTSGRAGNARVPACRTRPTLERAPCRNAVRSGVSGTPSSGVDDVVAWCPWGRPARARCAWFLRLGLLRHARTRAFPERTSVPDACGRNRHRLVSRPTPGRAGSAREPACRTRPTSNRACRPSDVRRARASPSLSLGPRRRPLRADLPPRSVAARGLACAPGAVPTRDAAPRAARPRARRRLAPRRARIGASRGNEAAAFRRHYRSIAA
jgi:hypothetical protein